MEIKDILNHTAKMPRLLSQTLLALTTEQREAFVAAFTAEVAKKEAISKRVGLAPIRRPNFTRDTERLVASMSKRKSA